MSITEMIIAIVGGLVLLSGVFNISMRRERLLFKLIGETGYRILMIVLGAVFVYLAVFTNYFAQ